MSGGKIRIMLVGPVSSGKSTLCQALNNTSISYKKTQSIEVINNTLDTPGEYLENRGFYRVLVVSAAEVSKVLLLQNCTDKRMLYPPAFASMFAGKDVIGIISKIDLSNDISDIEFAKQRLKIAGVSKCFMISTTRGDGLDTLRDYLYN